MLTVIWEKTGFEKFYNICTKVVLIEYSAVSATAYFVPKYSKQKIIFNKNQTVQFSQKGHFHHI